MKKIGTARRSSSQIKGFSRIPHSNFAVSGKSSFLNDGLIEQGRQDLRNSLATAMVEFA
jgi:hypothetical protein